jgi:hypothetical protein
MEVYILDSLYRDVQVVDDFNSCIWTERHRAWGDFEIHIQSTQTNRRRLVPGVRLAMSSSYRIMMVETVEDSTDDSGVTQLKVTGRSLEAILDSRAALSALVDTTTTPKWILTGTPGDIMRQIFHDICVTGTLDAGDIIPMVTEGSIFPPDTIEEITDEVELDLDPTTVYAAIKGIADIYLMGFRLVRDPVTNTLYWDVYTGSDRTTTQTDLPAVIFSPDMDNLQNTTELVSNAIYKNVAYVVSPVGFEVVYPLDVDPSVAGFSRQVILVNASDITDTDPDVASAKMIQKGKDALAQNRNVRAFDGELNQDSAYKYGVDYNLGDLVEQTNVDGVTNQMQVTEQIFVSDEQGERSYPTLSLFQLITPGTWLSQPIDLNWTDVDPDIDWVDYE